MGAGPTAQLLLFSAALLVQFPLLARLAHRRRARRIATNAEAMLRQKVLRVIFQQGFFKVRDLNLKLTAEPIELHVPYWLGFLL